MFPALIAIIRWQLNYLGKSFIEDRGKFPNNVTSTVHVQQFNLPFAGSKAAECPFGMPSEPMSSHIALISTQAIQDTVSPQYQAEGAHTPCECSYSVFQVISELRDQSMFNFETVLDIGHRIFEQWDKVRSCEHCHIDQQFVVTLPVVAERILALYEAACSTYAITQPDSAMGSGEGSPRSPSSVALHARRPVPQSPPHQLVCLKSKMTFGKMELEGPNAKLLARILLSRSLLKLMTLLEDLKEMIEKLWNNDCAHQADILKACGTSTATVMDKLIVLIGEIR